MQLVVVAVIIAASVAYALWRAYQAFQGRKSPCCGCEGCELKGQITEKCSCCDKKT